jgi:hypothetical protein
MANGLGAPSGAYVDGVKSWNLYVDSRISRAMYYSYLREKMCSWVQAKQR